MTLGLKLILWNAIILKFRAGGFAIKRSNQYSVSETNGFVFFLPNIIFIFIVIVMIGGVGKKETGSAGNRSFE